MAAAMAAALLMLLLKLYRYITDTRVGMLNDNYVQVMISIAQLQVYKHQYRQM